MKRMEVALLEKTGLRIKGKKSIFVCNPAGKLPEVNGILVLGSYNADALRKDNNNIILRGPGEYELGGVKLTGLRYSQDTLFTLLIDGLTLLIGRAETVEKDVTKLHEYPLVVLLCDTIINPSVLASLSPNAVIFYGEKAEEVAKLFAKGGYKKEEKYQISADKLPAEMESVVLQ